MPPIELKTPLAIMQAKLEMFSEEHPDADSEVADLIRFQTDQCPVWQALSAHCWK